MITNVMMKTCLNQKIMKISNFIQAVKCIACSQPEFSARLPPKFRAASRLWSVAYVQNRKLSEGRIFPKAEFVRIFPESTEVWIEHTTWQSWSDT